MTARSAAVSRSTRQIARAAVLVVGLFFISRVLGLAREMIIGARFGTSAELDAYQAAFRVPDLLFQLVAGGALGSAFIPVFTGCLTRRDLTGAWRVFSGVTNLVLLVLTALAAAMALVAPWLVRTVLAPGFSLEQQALTAELVRWMLISTVIFGVSGIAMGVLNSFQHFLIPALAPILYNLSIIAGAWLLAPRLGVFGLVLGVVVGAALHLDIQLIGLWWYGAKYKPTLALGDPNVREVGRLMGPRVIGLAAVQVNFWVNTLLASHLATGSLAALNYAWLIMLLPQGIVAQGVATAAFPTFATLRSQGRFAELRQTVTATLRGVLFLSIPAAVGLLVWRTPLVRMLLERGEFDAESTMLTTAALAFYSIGLIGHSAVEILSRAGQYNRHPYRDGPDVRAAVPGHWGAGLDGADNDRGQDDGRGADYGRRAGPDRESVARGAHSGPRRRWAAGRRSRIRGRRSCAAHVRTEHAASNVTRTALTASLGRLSP